MGFTLPLQRVTRPDDYELELDTSVQLQDINDLSVTRILNDC